MSEGIVVKAKVKELSGEMNIAGDVVPALNVKVEALVKKAIERAKANGRRTLMAKDI